MKRVKSSFLEGMPIKLASGGGRAVGCGHCLYEFPDLQFLMLMFNFMSVWFRVFLKHKALLTSTFHF